MMLDVLSLVSDTFSRKMAEEFRRAYGTTGAIYVEIIDSAARAALERIGNSDALYHNVEHTLLVTQVGWDILRGKRLHEKVDAEDAVHFLLACLVHDIGYVKGICSGDTANNVVITETGQTMDWPRGASDACLQPYHVDRSKIFIMERISIHEQLDAERLSRAVELTRFPVPHDTDHQETNTEAGLVRAADLVGQLGDPLYLKKSKALFCEFEEIGINKQIGLESPADLVEQYPNFFWTQAYPYMKPALRYLDCTVSGRDWIAHLFRNVFSAEHINDGLI